MAKHKKKQPYDISLILLAASVAVTFFSILVYPGYRAGYRDQRLYLPTVEKILDPGLYPRDNFFQQDFDYTKYTIWDEAVAWFARLPGSNVWTVLFIMSILTTLVYNYAISRIAYHFTGDMVFSAVSPLLFITGTMFLASSLFSIDPVHVLPRTVSLALNLFSMYLLLENRKFPASFFLGIGILMNMLTAIPFIAFFGLYCLVSFLRTKSVLELVPVSVLGLFALGLQAWIGSSSNLGIFTRMDPEWYREFIYPNKYMITNWNIYSFLILIAGCILFWIAYREVFRKTGHKTNILLLFTIPLLLLAISFITVDILKLFFFYQFQLIERAWPLWDMSVWLLFSYYSWTSVLKNKGRIIENISLIGISLSLPVSKVFVMAFLPAYLVYYFRERLKNRTISIPGSFPWMLLLISVGGLAALLMIARNPLLLHFLIITMLSAVAAILNSRIKPRPVHAAAILGILVILGIISIPLLRLTPPELRDQSFEGLCMFLSGTPKDALLLTEPYTSTHTALMVRLLCKRSVYFTESDRTMALYSRAMGERSYKKHLELEQLRRSPNPSKIVTNDGIDYIVSEKRIDIGYPAVYNNSRYSVYKTD